MDPCSVIYTLHLHNHCSMGRPFPSTTAATCHTLDKSNISMGLFQKLSHGILYSRDTLQSGSSSQKVKHNKVLSSVRPSTRVSHLTLDTPATLKKRTFIQRQWYALFLTKPSRTKDFTLVSDRKPQMSKSLSRCSVICN